MGSYSGYRGQCVGRILHCLDIYCDTNERLQENACVGDGIITYRECPIAVYFWSADPNDDVPTINFLNNPKIEHTARFNKRAYFNKPFLDEFLPQSAEFLVQEICKAISFEDALAIKFIRDKHEGDWERVSWHGRPEAQRKIKRCIQKHASFCWGNDKINQHWKHLAMCAIYDI